jgi:hypothetical protein
MLHLIVRLMAGSAWCPAQERPASRRRLPRMAGAAWLVTAIVGALLPAVASRAIEVTEVAKLPASNGVEAAVGFSVAVDGIVSSTLLTLLVLPALYRLLHGRDAEEAVEGS